MKKQFEVRHLDKHSSDLDWEPVEAFDEWDAAKSGADRWDSEDRYMLRSNETHTFEVRDSDGNVTRWSVWGEALLYYYASPVPDYGQTTEGPDLSQAERS
jgi:hypothetical protein